MMIDQSRLQRMIRFPKQSVDHRLVGAPMKKKRTKLTTHLKDQHTPKFVIKIATTRECGLRPWTHQLWSQQRLPRKMMNRQRMGTTEIYSLIPEVLTITELCA
jgi:hypothetical protein